MTLPASGSISMSQIAVELGRSASATVSLLEQKSLDLAQSAAPITLPDSFYSKSVIQQTDSRSAAASHANVQYGQDPGAGRWVVILATHADTVANPGNTPTMTISGAGANRLVSATTGDGVDDACGTAIFTGQPSGTQGTVAGSWGGLAMAIVVYRVVNYACGTAYSSDSSQPAGGGTMTFNVPDKGLVICAGARSLETGSGINWTNLTERGEDVVNATRRGWAYDYLIPANASYGVSMTPWTFGNGENIVVGVAFAVA